MNSRKSILYFVNALVGILVLFGTQATHAGPISLGLIWHEFSFTDPGTPAQGCQPDDPLGLFCEPSSSGNSTFLDSPPWTFSNSTKVTFQITDAFSAGDQFIVFDFGSPILITSFVADSLYNCGNDPAVCLTDSQISHGSTVLYAGDHSITIDPLLSPSFAGSAYFRVIPEPSTALLFGPGLLSIAWRINAVRCGKSRLS